MNRTYSITLDFKETQPLITDISYKQYDYGTSFLGLTLTFEGEPAYLGNEVVAAVFKTAKGKIILDNNNKPATAFGYITKVEEGQALIQIPNEVLEFPGKCTCEVVSFLYNGNSRRTTQSFSFQVVSSITELEPVDPPEELLSIVGMFLCGQMPVGYGKPLTEGQQKDVRYAPTLWRDGITPVNAINLNKIENELLRLADLQSDEIGYVTDFNTDIRTVKDALDILLYVPLTINFMTKTPTLEKGTILDEITLTWTYNKPIVKQNINGNTLNILDRYYILMQTISDNKSFTLTANDGKIDYSKTITISFLNGRYWGTSSGDNYDSTFIKSLNKELNESISKTFTVDCATNEYIFYCFPSRIGTPTFTVNGFNGGFIKVKTIQFENDCGFIEDYDIWKSSNGNLGNTTVTVR